MKVKDNKAANCIKRDYEEINHSKEAYSGSCSKFASCFSNLLIEDFECW